MDHNLSQENYAKVLAYMERTNQEDFDTASRALQNTHYDLDQAIVSYHQSREQPRNYPHREVDQEQVEAVKKYFLFIQEKKRRSPGIIRLLFYGIRHVFKSIFKGLASILLPHSFFIKLFFPRFFGLYFNQLHLPIQKSSLEELLAGTRRLGRKSVLIAISPEQVHPGILNLLNNPPISQSIAIWFNFVGYTFGDRSLQLLGDIQKEPQIIICRRDAMDKVVILSRFTLEQFGNITPEILRQNYLQGLKQREKDRVLINAYKIFINRGSPFNRDYYESQQQIPPLRREVSASVARVREQIAGQNEAYLALEREQLQRSRLMHQQEQMRLQERQREQEEEYLRRIRRESIPEQPKQGNFVRISFRCPNGTTLVRNFQSQQKVQLVYSWVQVNEQIQFEQAKKRTFQLMHSYPLIPLSQSREKRIGEVFQDTQAKVVIREL